MVRDAGIGIGPEDIPYVFNMFAQADRSLSESKGGLGLGLHLAKSLMEMHGGNLTASSDGIGCGSTFSVRLPLLPLAGHEESDALDAPAGVSVLSGLDIVIADDNQDAREALSLLLNGVGAKVRIATGGREVIDVCIESAPHVVIMDVGMPGIDGLQATREIRRRVASSPPIIIALTGWGRAEDRSMTTAAGFDGHLVKPVKLDELETTLKGIIDARSK